MQLQEKEQRLLDLLKINSRTSAEIESLVTVAGLYDFIAKVRTDGNQHMDRILTEIAMMDGIIKTESHIILSEKFNRKL